MIYNTDMESELYIFAGMDNIANGRSHLEK